MTDKKTIHIDRRLCKNCGICAALCPAGCIQMDKTDTPSVQQFEECLGCMMCEYHCPDFAVRLKVETDGQT